MEKEVIIIGDGPSIRHYDLSSIDPNIDRIYCGSQILHKNFNINKSINSNYIIVEPRLLWPDFMLDKKRYYLKDERQKIKRILKGFKSNTNVNYYLHWTNAPFIFNLRNIKLVSNKKIPFTIKLNHMSGSFYACISLANYLGYDKIHLLGFDSFVLNKSSDNRWYEKLGEITKNNSKNAVQFIINKFHHMNFKVVSEHELILDSSKLMKSDLNIKYNKNRFNLIDLVNKNDIEIMSMSKYINIDI
tara:strand:- start:1592 stop:2326 length:735 start_codon:yes stop_codon:yes gene_type:complete